MLSLTLEVDIGLLEYPTSIDGLKYHLSSDAFFSCVVYLSQEESECGDA